MRYFLSLFACACSFLSAAESPILKQFPSSSHEVSSFTGPALQGFDRQFLDFIDQPARDLNFENVVDKWSNLISPLFNKGVILTFLPLTTQNVEIIQKADEEAKLLQQKLWMTMHDPKALSLFVNFVKNPVHQKTMTPYQIYKVDSILENMTEGALEKEVVPIRKALSQYEKKAYLYAKGFYPEKKQLENNNLTILS